MKFGKHLRENTLKEWRFYAVDYKQLKKLLSSAKVGSTIEDNTEFFTLLQNSERKLAKFYHDREKWAKSYTYTLEERVANVREVSSSPATTPTVSSLDSLTAFDGSDCILDDENTTTNDSNVVVPSPEPRTTTILDIDGEVFQALTKKQSFGTKQAWLKEEYRRLGNSKEFKAFIYAKKSLATFDRELELLLEFLALNKTAFSKILKKYDKRTGSSIRHDEFRRIHEANSYLDGKVLRTMKKEIEKLIDEVNALKPQLPEGWENRKVYTIGCFDLFHRGHENVLLSLREFGYYLVAGIHDDASYILLKNKPPIENLETRMENIRPYVDQIFVIPATDPTLFIKSMVSPHDIAAGSCCYARGDDMIHFPSRDWVETVMPVHFVPRTEACSSTLLRTIYHAEDEEVRQKAAFAKTRYDGKPVDEDGNLLHS